MRDPIAYGLVPSESMPKKKDMSLGSDEEILKKYVMSSESHSRNTLNPKLAELVERYMPKQIDGVDITEAERAIYIYHMLCVILVFDKHIDRYISGDGITDDEKIKNIKTFIHHDEVTETDKINADNNEVSCHEFNEIYSLFLARYGTKHEVKEGDSFLANNRKKNLLANNVTDETDNKPWKHEFCIVNASDMIFMADATSYTDISESLANKVKRYSGLELITDDDERISKFEQSKQRVLSYMKGVELDTIVENLLREYECLAENMDKSSLTNNEQTQLVLNMLQRKLDISDSEKMLRAKRLVELIGGKIEYVKKENRRRNTLVGIIQYPYDDGEKRVHRYGLYNPKDSSLSEMTEDEVREYFKQGRISVYSKRNEKNIYNIDR